ncbi:hypothetical protein [Chitinophaga sp.]|uniref:hypothetical protein n=1 Tax=Chitinophaga sp. TaxID=1869181 RepID=UPI0031E22F36
MFPYNQSIYDLLYPRVDPFMLKGYYGGVFNDMQDQFYAASYVNKVLEDQDLNDLKLFFEGYTIVSQISANTPEGLHWASLSPEEQYEAAQMEPDSKREYSGYSASFYGALYRGEWYVLPSVSVFCGMNEGDVMQLNTPEHVFSRDTYRSVSQTTWATNAVTMREFADAPWLVAHLLQQKKERINHAFRHYFTATTLAPLAAQLRLRYPEKYDVLDGLFGARHFTSIFPEHKQFVLLGTAARGRHDTAGTLRYLLYQCKSGEVFEWTYFSNRAEIRGHYPELVITQLKTISPWDEVDYLHSSCTLDDDRFWEQYVFAKENGKYRYLKKLEL